MFSQKSDTVIFEEWGYLEEFNSWSPEVAVFIASKEGIDVISEQQWVIINFLRDYFAHNNICPKVRTVLDGLGMSLKQVYDLFPFGLIQSAFKVAGLPKPGDCN